MVLNRCFGEPLPFVQLTLLFCFQFTFLLLILPILGTHPNAVRVTAHALSKRQLPQLSPAYNP